MIKTHRQPALLLCLLLLSFNLHAAPGATKTASEPAISVFQGERAKVASELSEAQTESAKYTGGLIKAQIESRVEVLKLTLAIIDQRLAGAKAGTKLRVEVPVTLPNSDEAEKLEKELSDIDARIRHTEENAAKYSGGLILAQPNSNIATLQGTRALLQQRQLTAKYGLAMFPVSITAKSSTEKGTGLKAEPAKSKPLADTIISVDLLGKHYREEKYGRGGVYFDLKFTAAGLDKPVRAIKGSLHITDLFDESIVGIKWSLDKPMSPGATYSENSVGFDYNRFMNNHQRVRDTEASDLRARFHVESILYEDGTRRDF
jgi:hypothetical protein